MQLKKLLVLVLAVLLAVFASAAAFADDAPDHTGDIAITADTQLINSDGTYYLDGNTVLNGTLTVSGTADVTLCLNGYMLTAPGGIVVTDGASLTVDDCYSAATHVGEDFTHTYTSAVTNLDETVTGGAIVAKGKATVVQVSNGAAFTLNSGVLASGSYSQGAVGAGGVFVRGGTFVMNGGVLRDNVATGTAGGAICAATVAQYPTTIEIRGGEICNNVAARFAGALYVPDGLAAMSGGALVTYGVNVVISGGSIHDNRVTTGGVYAGGVFLGKYATATFVGGSITRNYAAGQVGGVYLSAYMNQVNVGGGAVINGNYAGSTISASGTVSAPGAACNLYIAQDKTSKGTKQANIKTTGALLDSAHISVTFGAAVDTSVTVITPEDGCTISASDLLKFHSDDAKVSFALTDAGALQLCIGRSHFQCGIACTHDPAHESALYQELEPHFTGGELHSGNYYLSGDIDLSAPIMVDGQVNLCLEGYAITCVYDYVFVVPAGSELNLMDCFVPSAGAAAEYKHSHVTVPSGTVTTVGGVVKGHILHQSGGILVDGGTFQLFSGTIAGGYYNSGVTVKNSGTFRMYGGNISNNYTPERGGGICVDETGTLAIYGGAITRNQARILGGGVYAPGGFTLSGNVTVTENIVGVRADNVYLPDGTMIHVTGPVSGKIGIRMEVNGVFTTGGAGASVSAFKADAEIGTYVDAENDELIVTSYGVSVQPTPRAPTVFMKGPEDVSSYQWYEVSVGSTRSLAAQEKISLAEGETVKVTDLADDVTIVRLATLVEVEIDGVTERVLDIKCEGTPDAEGNFYATAPAADDYYLITRGDAYIAATVTQMPRGAAVANQTAATYTGFGGLYICRVAYSDGVSVVYSHPFYAINHKHEDSDVDYTPLGNDFSGGLMVGKDPSSTQLLNDEDGVGCYYLASDVTLSSALHIEGTVTLCLNGHTLKVNGDTAIDIADGASLTICTCGEKAKSVLTGTGGANGGAIYNAGTFNAANMTIRNCTAANGSAVYNEGVMTLNHVSITGCASDANGGAVYTAGTCALTDVSITGGTAGCGVRYLDGSLSLSGSITVTGNSGGNLFIAAGRKLTITDLDESSGVGVSTTPGAYGVFSDTGAELLDCFFADAPGGFVTTNEDALTLDQYAILQQPTGQDRTVKVNDPDHAHYLWYEYEEENVEDLEAPLSLTAGQVLVLTVSGMEEGSTATVNGMTATLREDDRFVYYITADGDYTLPDLGETQYTAVVYTLKGILAEQTHESLSAGAGGYICDVTYDDGTVLRTEFVVVNPVFFTSETNYTNPFEDVAKEDWYYVDVMKLAEKKLMIGVTEDEFAPEADSTRAMAVTVLWRMDDEQPADAAVLFSDVAVEDYFYTAVAWATKTKVVVGVSESEFAPELSLTREQAVLLLYRYTQYKQGVKPAGTADLSKYKDAPSAWAAEAMQWAVARGYVKANSNGELRAQDVLSRAALANLIVNYLGL